MTQQQTAVWRWDGSAEGFEAWSGAHAGTGAVLIPGTGGPEHLPIGVVDFFLACEKHGLVTVLVAQEVDDLDTGLARICQFVMVTSDDEVAQEARGIYGRARVWHTPGPHVPGEDGFLAGAPRPWFDGTFCTGAARTPSVPQRVRRWASRLWRRLRRV